MKDNKMLKLIPVMLCFFAMGFVDLVGTATNFVKQDLGLSDSTANIFPSLVFFWFLIFSVPTGMLMNKIGRKKTVLLSLVITLLSLLLPIFGENYYLMLICFSLLGIGNAIMQTSLNPLISNIISGDKLASTLTFGQFVKAIASFMAPLIAMWGAQAVIPSMGLGWRVLFPIYMIIGILATFLLSLTTIKEEEVVGKASTFSECFKLLGIPIVLLSFIGIMCHVGIDVGINTTAPRLLAERTGIPLTDAAFATTIYFVFRTFGCLAGSYVLTHFNHRKFFLISVSFIAIAMLLMIGAKHQFILYTAFAMVGLGNSNVFSVIFSQALLSVPNKKNEVSGLMIMGLFGGTVFPLFMGFASDAFGQAGAVLIMAVGAVYLLYYVNKIDK
ncbi:MAG: MFS transporter [Phocaeicola sp.]|uniref:MFS transporter n=1 Tax=Phocaeicola TaxID=909656 RepID=UPI00234ED290|nr:MFS transporter [Phocaeicola oris]MCE2617059.1 MFS transporter [Phocaeicola oris]